jgi:aminoglycoside phosphotransferase (APT) family kinase protein
MTPTITEALVQRLVASQFPQWADLPIRAVARSGWCNRTFHLGDGMIVRLPSAAEYAASVDKEHAWLPRLAPLLPLPIPTPLAMGAPAEGYLWKWSVYSWLDGENAASNRIADVDRFATDLGAFLSALQGIDAAGGPVAGPHNFFRGGLLSTYDAETRVALTALKGTIDVDAATSVWEHALSTTWQRAPVWVHGDIGLGNLLLREGRLSAVIDFGELGVGDPACDLAIAWTLFDDDSRNAFRAALSLDAETWARGRGWTLWKALIVAAGMTNTNAAEAAEPWRVIEQVMADHRRSARSA